MTRDRVNQSAAATALTEGTKRTKPELTEILLALENRARHA